MCVKCVCVCVCVCVFAVTGSSVFPSGIITVAHKLEEDNWGPSKYSHINTHKHVHTHTHFSVWATASNSFLHKVTHTCCSLLIWDTSELLQDQSDSLSQEPIVRLSWSRTSKPCIWFSMNVPFIKIHHWVNEENANVLTLWYYPREHLLKW